jgi:hypothetical protein
VRISVTDAEYPGLTYQQAFTLSVTAPPPAPPLLSLPSLGVSGYQGGPVPLQISATPGDNHSVVTVTLNHVPPGVTFSAGSNNGNGSWTFTQSQLSGLTVDVPTATSFVLQVVATATSTQGGGTTTSTSQLTIATAAAVPTIAFSAPTTFNPQSPLVLIVSTSDPVPEKVQSVTVNWGDGTVDTFTGPPTTYTHQYVVSNTSYTIQVAVTDQNGTFSTPAGLTVAGTLPTAQQAIVAALYLDLLGRNADAGGLTNFAAQLAAGASISQIVAALTGSNEYQVKSLNDLYEKFLGRPVDAQGEAAFLPLLATSGPQAVAAAILSSQEFYDKAGGTDEDFLQALYLAVLGREIDAAGLANDLAALSFGASREQIALGVLYSTEEAKDVVEQTYETYLDRPADPEALPGWEKVYLSDPASFLVSFLNSAEFAARSATVEPVSPYTNHS